MIATTSSAAVSAKRIRSYLVSVHQDAGASSAGAALNGMFLISTTSPRAWSKPIAERTRPAISSSSLGARGVYTSSPSAFGVIRPSTSTATDKRCTRPPTWVWLRSRREIS
jgi:hypothetical protein